MHELPKDLTNSLRSFRGSIYGQRDRPDIAAREPDLEKSEHSGAYADKEFEQALSDTDMSSTADAVGPGHVSDHPYDGLDEHYDDLEKQEAELPPLSTNQPPPQPNANGAPPVTATPKSAKPKKTKTEIFGAQAVEDLNPAADRLAHDLTPLAIADFCSLMGMRQPTSPQDSLAHLSIPHGLYDKIHRHMRYNNRKFRMFDVATYALLLVQLMISAVFIILGALEKVDTHITIAVLGAVATVLSGGLALMKGQGLPNRLRQTRDSLRNVMFEAEELYWDVRSGRPVLYKDIKKIREDFLRVLQQARAHHPDAWSGDADAMAPGGPPKLGGGGKKGGK